MRGANSCAFDFTSTPATVALRSAVEREIVAHWDEVERRLRELCGAGAEDIKLWCWSHQTRITTMGVTVGIVPLGSIAQRAQKIV